MKILIIEDDAAVRDTLKDLLELNGHHVLAAADGVEGVQLAEKNPDFIFCDINMPRMDGYAAIEAIRKCPATRETPFVFLSAKADRTDLRQGMNLGADDYITKPFTERDILGAIAAREQRRQTYQERVVQLSAQRRHEINAQWAHELLTPLNAVFGCLSLLEAEADTIDRSELKDLLATIRAGAERQERLSLKLIRFFELEQLRDSTNPILQRSCDVRTAIDNGVARALRESERSRKVNVEMESTAEVPVRLEYLSHAVYEIVDNALRFSPASETVLVRGMGNAGRCRIEVLDSGPGLTADQVASVGAFVQFDRRKMEQQGLGLGIAIARAAAGLARGTLILEPNPAGKGLRVLFDLPATTAGG